MPLHGVHRHQDDDVWRRYRMRSESDEHGWSCCDKHGKKHKCPADYPLMCHFQTCHKDYCCDTTCLTYGGLRRCEACIETLRGFRDDAYRGCQQMTRSGKECQRWDEQSPNSHATTPANYPLADLRENFCRNPDGSLTIWCYVKNVLGEAAGKSSPDRWEYCDPMQEAFGAGPPRCPVALPLVGPRHSGRVTDSQIT